MTVKTKLVEFKADDGQGEVPDPIAKDTSRSADKHNGETSIPSFATKAEAMNAVVQKLSGLPKEAIGDIFKGMTEKLGHSPEKARATRRIAGATAKDDGPPGEGETIKNSEISTTSDKPFKYKGEAKEDIDFIFGTDTLTEDSRERALVIFEAAVNSRLEIEFARLEEAFQYQLVEELETKIANLSENIDKYLSYVVSQWASDNELAIENGLKAEVTEDFIHGLKNLFLENYVEIPDDKVDLIGELSSQIKELETKINTVVKENIEIKEYVDTLEVEKVFAEAVKTIPLTQQEKLRTLVEGVEYTDTADFTKKLNIIKETYFSADGTAKKVSLVEDLNYVNSEEEEVQENTVTGPMSYYVKAISQTTKK